MRWSTFFKIVSVPASRTFASFTLVIHRQRAFTAGIVIIHARASAWQILDVNTFLELFNLKSTFTKNLSMSSCCHWCYNLWGDHSDRSLNFYSTTLIFTWLNGLMSCFSVLDGKTALRSAYRASYFFLGCWLLARFIRRVETTSRQRSLFESICFIHFIWCLTKDWIVLVTKLVQLLWNLLNYFFIMIDITFIK